MKVKDIKRFITNLIFPPRCPGCDEVLFDQSAGFCENCMVLRQRITGRCCPKCGRPVGKEEVFCKRCEGNNRLLFESARGVYIYSGVMKTAMYRFKYSNRRSYARVFVRDAIRQNGRWLREVSPDVIIPVPMYHPKKRKRGYNQAEVFAACLGEALGIPVINDLVIRKKNTVPMKGLTPQNRENNVKNAFIIKESEVQFKRVLLVDDIFTTGATLNEVSRVLGEHFKCSIFALYICTPVS